MTFCRHACGGKFTRAGAIISNGLLDSRTVCPLFLQFREQPGELAEVTQLGVWAEGVFSARRGENENQRAIEPLLLQSELAWPLGEILIGRLAVESDHLRGILLKFLRQQNAALGEFLATQFLDPARRPLDQIGQTDSEFDHTLVITMIEKFRHNPGIVKQRPEFISTPGVIMPNTSRAVPGITTHDDKSHTAAKMVRQSSHFVPGLSGRLRLSISCPSVRVLNSSVQISYDSR